MIIRKLEVGPIMANCYVLGCEETKEAVVIDPGDESDRILMAVAKDKLTVKYIINTHGHFDHAGANKDLKNATNAKLMIHGEDEHMLLKLSLQSAAFGFSVENSPPADIILSDNDEIKFGTITLKVIHTPGHSKGGICLLTDNILIVGDTLFAGSIGRTDIHGGDHEALIAGIKTKLFVLDDKTIVYPGHGPETFIGREKKTNPFLL